MNNINKKINKYQLKLKMDPSKRHIYNEKLKYYKSQLMNGGEIIEDVIRTRADQALNALDEIKATVTGTDVQNQLNDLVATSNTAVENYNNLGNSYRNTANQFINFTDQIIDKAKNKTIEAEFKIPDESFNGIKRTLQSISSNPDDLIISSLIKDIKKGADVSDEVATYGLENNQRIQNALNGIFDEETVQVEPIAEETIETPILETPTLEEQTVEEPILEPAAEEPTETIEAPIIEEPITEPKNNEGAAVGGARQMKRNNNINRSNKYKNRNNYN